MTPHEQEPPASQQPSPPRAFTQGVGTVFQFAGVGLFLVMTTVCCGSSLLSKQTAQRTDLESVGWQLPGGLFYAAPLAISVCVFTGVALGTAVAGLGLGMQATHRSAAFAGAGVSVLGAIFWLIHTIYAIERLGSWLGTTAASLLFLLFVALSILACGAAWEMLRHPPPPDHEILPADYKVPYSHLHQDPPEVRLAHEIEQRRRRLAVEQKELEMLEEKIRRARRLDEGRGP